MNESSPDEPEMIPGTEGESKGVTDMEGSPVPAKAPEDRPADSMPLADGAGEPAEERTATIYWLILTVLFVGAIVLRRFPFDDNEARHVIWEFISTTLALVVGALSLVRFYSKKQETFLFIGTGFLGTGLLNGYHAFTTSAFIGAGGGGRARDRGRGRMDLDGLEAVLVDVPFRERFSLVGRIRVRAIPRQ